MSFILDEILDSIASSSFKMVPDKFDTKRKNRLLAHHLDENDHHSKSENIIQLRCVAQIQGNICGYHTIYNLYILVSAIQSDDPRSQLSFLCDKYAFWRSYHQVKEMLHKNSRNVGYYPWEHTCIDSDIIERDYARYILGEYLQTNSITDLPEMTLGSLQNGIMPMYQLESVHKIFQTFQKKSNYFHAFWIGAKNHWLGLIINKHDGITEAYYVDSRDIQLLGKSHDDILKEVEKKLFEAQQRKTFTEKESKRYKKDLHGSLQDTLNSLDLLYGCATGMKNFVQEILKIELEHIIDRFENIHNETDLCEYLDGYCPSHCVARSVEKTLPHLTLDSVLKSRLLKWRNQLKSLIGDTNHYYHLGNVLKLLNKTI